LSVFNNNLIIAHYNAADLSMLNDFEEVKKDLSVVGKCWVTPLGAKPLTYD
jgi:hypothetical protein